MNHTEIASIIVARHHWFDSRDRGQPKERLIRGDEPLQVVQAEGSRFQTLRTQKYGDEFLC
jgi:hypothetical protein